METSRRSGQWDAWADQNLRCRGVRRANAQASKCFWESILKNSIALQVIDWSRGWRQRRRGDKGLCRGLALIWSRSGFPGAGRDVQNTQKEGPKGVRRRRERAGAVESEGRSGARRERKTMMKVAALRRSTCKPSSTWPQRSEQEAIVSRKRTVRHPNESHSSSQSAKKDEDRLHRHAHGGLRLRRRLQVIIQAHC